MRRIKIGDVYAIPLPNGLYAYARVFKDAGFGVYNKLGDTLNPEIDEEWKYQFIISVFKDLLQDGQWIYVKNIPFRQKDEEWPPKRYIRDPISNSYSIYYKGEIKSSSVEECIGLEYAEVWDRELVVNRIMKEIAD